MDITEFRATAKPCTDELWAEFLNADVVPPDGKGSITEYVGYTALHTYDGKFWPHAWWYPPVPYATLSEAEEELCKWYNEFQ